MPAITGITNHPEADSIIKFFNLCLFGWRDEVWGIREWFMLHFKAIKVNAYDILNCDEVKQVYSEKFSQIIYQESSSLNQRWEK